MSAWTSPSNDSMPRVSKAGSRRAIVIAFATLTLWSARCLPADPPTKPAVTTGSAKADAIGQNAQAKDGGIAINASGNAKVEVHQTIQQRDPEVVRLLKRLQEDHRQIKKELSELRRDGPERQQQLLREQADGIDEVVRKARAPNASPAALAAKRGLEQGNTVGAEALLGEDERAALAKQPPAARRAAELARQAGALATNRDTKAALAAYQRATEYEPDNPDNWWMLGDLLMDSLQRPQAAQAYQRLLELALEGLRSEPASAKWRSTLGASYRKVAAVLLAQQDVAGAALLAQKSLALAEQWLAEQSTSRQAQDEMIASLMLVGRVRFAEAKPDEIERDLPAGADRVAATLDAIKRRAGESKAAYERSLTFINGLLDRNVKDDDLWLQHSDCHMNIGWALAVMSQGGAKGEFLRSVATLERIVQRNPDSSYYRSKLALGYKTLGGYLATGEKDPAASLVAYRNSLSILEQVARQDPSNPLWKLNLVTLYQAMAWLAQPWASVPSLLDVNYRDHMKPPPISHAEAMSLLQNAQRILKQLQEANLLIAHEQDLERQIQVELADLQCQQKGFETNLAGKCIRPLPPHMR